MAKRYTATIDLRCGKEHTCSGCGSVYSYLFVRKIGGTAGTADAAQVNARKAADKALATDTDPRACPHCGVVQPDMIGQRRRRAHWTVFWLALLVLGVLLILRATYVLRADTGTWAITGVCAVAALAYGSADLKDLNRDLEANRRDTAERITAGTMFAHAAGRTEAPAPEWVRPPRGVFHRLALLLLLVAVALAASPELFRMASHWPANADAYPPVVGPGDETRIYMNQKIHSVQGLWNGTPVVTVTPPGGPPVKVDAVTNQSTWSRTIYAKSSEKDNSSSPWVRLFLPNDAALAGKTVQCDIELKVDYPQMVGASTWEPQKDTLTRNLTLNLAPAGAGTRYNGWWWTATALAIGVILLCGIVLAGAAGALRKRANPTRILP